MFHQFLCPTSPAIVGTGFGYPQPPKNQNAQKLIWKIEVFASSSNLHLTKIEAFDEVLRDVAEAAHVLRQGLPQPSLHWVRSQLGYC